MRRDLARSVSTSFEEGEVMKLIVCALFAALFVSLTGCTLDTPAYTSSERFQQIHRNNVYQAQQGQDDIDNVLLLRPSTQLTYWNVYHRD
jgi:hypothetical protein